MGDHLIKLGEKQSKKDTSSPPSTTPIIQTMEEAEEQRKMKEILNNPKVNFTTKYNLLHL